MIEHVTTMHVGVEQGCDEQPAMVVSVSCQADTRILDCAKMPNHNYTSHCGIGVPDG